MLQHFFEKRNALTLLEGEAQLGALKATSDSHWAVIGDFEISYSARGAKLHVFPLPSDASCVQDLSLSYSFGWSIISITSI